MQCGEQTQLKFSFQLCLDFSRLRIYCKAEKENGVTARRSSLPLSERLSAKSPHFLFQIWSWRRCRQMKAKPHSRSGAAECEYVNCSTYVNL